MAGSRQDDEFEQARDRSTLEALFRAARLLNGLALERVNQARAGKPPLRSAHTSLLAHIDREGTRLTRIAQRAGVTKQAVAQLVAELEEAGVVERVPDPSDGRAKLVRARPGQLTSGLLVLHQLEQELRAATGDAAVDDLRRGLLAVLEKVEQLRPGAARARIDTRKTRQARSSN